MESRKEIPQKLKVKVPFDQGTPLLGIFPKQLKTSYYNDTFITIFTRAEFIIVESCKKPICPSTGK